MSDKRWFARLGRSQMFIVQRSDCFLRWERDKETLRPYEASPTAQPEL